jgi:O-acetyl-ADP-ribose deacetylase
MNPATRVQKKKDINGTVLRIVQGDLVKQDVEAIVNAANPFIEGGGGVDGRIHQAAGPELKEACRRYKKEHKIDRIQVADAMLTDSFTIRKLTPKIQYVIHTVGPDCRVASQREDKEHLLQGAYLNALELAREKGIQSIAFPALSTGAYSYPFWEAQHVALAAIKEYLNNHPHAFSEVLLVYYSEEDFQNAARVWDEIIT